MKILVINSGSSSIKYELFDMSGPTSLVTGIVERIGDRASRARHQVRHASGETEEQVYDEPFANHGEGLRHIQSFLRQCGLLGDLQALRGIGHRVVHGGEQFREPTLLDDEVIRVIDEQSMLAPLHNPANLLGIRQTIKACPDVPQVAVFDTAFHQTIPRHAHLYAIPHDLYARFRIRRYGFHGTSHRFVAKAAAEYLGRPLTSLRLITIHLGNGASIAAIDHGNSVDTSMGMTPLEGLVMGTRSGDLDPAIPLFLARQEGIDIGDVDVTLRERSGLKGICGDNDMREILRRAGQGDDRAELALQMYSYRVKKYLGAYLAVLGGADAVVFTAGIGENVPRVRHDVCDGLEALGIRIDAARNAAPRDRISEIHAAESRVRLLVVPTDEELEIAIQTQQCIADHHR
jgi:acetate kinase